MDEEAPDIPAGAIDLTVAYEEYYKSQSSQWYTPERANTYLPLEADKVYFVPEGKTFADPLNLNDASNISIYVAGTWSVSKVQGNPDMNVFVLESGTLNWGLYSWQEGQLNIGDGKADIVKCWGKINPYFNGNVCDKITSVQIKGKSKLFMFDGGMDELYVAKADEWNGGTLFVETGAEFYSSIPVSLAGKLGVTNGGDMHFDNTLLCMGDADINSGSEITFGKCSTIKGKAALSGGETKIYINEYLSVGNLDIDGCKLYVSNALIDVAGTTIMYAAGNEGLIKAEDGEYRSILRTGKLVLNAYQPTNRQITTLAGNLDVLSEDIQGGNEQLDAEKLSATALKEGVAFNPENVYLPATDCRAMIGEKPETEEPDIELIEVIGILPPAGSHPYSATGFDFNEEQGIIYLGWHANQKWESEWGGYMDVIKVDSYNIEGSMFAQTWRNKEMKFNHTLYYNGKVYGAGTSNKIGAALFELPVNANGLFNEDIDSSYTRVNIEGESANCVELAGDNLLTISGWRQGGINVVPVNAQKAESTYFTGFFMGKYIYSYKNTIVTLHNTDKGIVEVYDAQDDVNATFANSPHLTFEAGELAPQDGKNVCICDDDYIYVCRGNNKLAIFDFTGKQVAETTASANGVDVDDEFIYLASGNGVKIYKKSDITGEDLITLTPVAKCRITEATAIQEPKNSLIGQSSNFIRKGKDNLLYVAYGVYGLRIYQVNKK